MTKEEIISALKGVAEEATRRGLTADAVHAYAVIASLLGLTCHHDKQSDKETA